MAEREEFLNEQEMKRHIIAKWHGLLDAEDIAISENSYSDDRIGWKDARYVCVKKVGEDDYIKKYGHPQCIGTCATKYK